MNVESLLINFPVKKRSNLFYRFYDDDLIKYTVQCDFQLPLVLSIHDKKHNKIIRKKYIDINYFTEMYNDILQNDNLCLNTEDYSLVKEMFLSKSSNLSKNFTAILDNLKFLYISDRKNFDRFELTVIMTCLLPKTKEKAEEQLNFLHELIDYLRTVKLGNTVSFIFLINLEKII